MPTWLASAVLMLSATSAGYVMLYLGFDLDIAVSVALVTQLIVAKLSGRLD